MRCPALSLIKNFAKRTHLVALHGTAFERGQLQHDEGVGALRLERLAIFFLPDGAVAGVSAFGVLGLSGLPAGHKIPVGFVRAACLSVGLDMMCSENCFWLVTGLASDRSVIRGNQQRFAPPVPWGVLCDCGHSGFRPLPLSGLEKQPKFGRYCHSTLCRFFAEFTAS